LRLLSKSIFSFLILFLVVTGQNVSQTKNLIVVDVITFEKLKKIIDENHDHAMLINVWATWCIPCREEFPELVKIANDYKDEVRVIGISLDEPEILDTEVIPFLKSYNAEFENYILKTIEPEEFINLLSKEWSGAIPATFIYDKKGNQKEILIGKQSFDSFNKAVKEAIE
jgi:thiol-disulfide isomerase/thioredoxin